MYLAAFPFGWTRTTGARQRAGTVTCWRIRASPSDESGTGPAVKAGAPFESGAQKSDAELESAVAVERGDAAHQIPRHAAAGDSVNRRVGEDAADQPRREQLPARA